MQGGDSCKKRLPELSCLKIVNERGNFVQDQGAKAEHTLRYVSILLSAGLCKKNSSEQFLHKKIVNERGNFVQG